MVNYLINYLNKKDWDSMAELANAMFHPWGTGLEIVAREKMFHCLLSWIF
jgi:hypothetical protein